MKRIGNENEVTYASRIPAELQMARLILTYLRIEPTGGMSSEGATITISRDDAKRFEEESREWLVAVTSVVQCLN
jgi:hypothetical protein